MIKIEVPFFGHKAMHFPIINELKKAIESVLTGDQLILGPQVKLFEANISKYLNTKFAIGVNSGLDALIIALRALGITNNDEVIVPANTYIATWNAISAVNAKPVAVEANADTLQIDVKKIEAAITAKTKAILPVHLYGIACDMQSILSLADKYNLYVIEDNAQALGAEVSILGKTGSIGHINATSFYPTKPLGAMGDGGMITTNNAVLYEKCKLLRNYGSPQLYHNTEIGYNSRLQEIQAAILNIKLPYLDQWNAQRRVLAEIYLHELQGIGDIILPLFKPLDVVHLFPIRTSHRNKLQEFLKGQGITCLIHYPRPPYLQQAYTSLNFKEGSFPISENTSKELLSLPLYPNMPMSHLDWVIDNVRMYYRKI